MFAAYPAAGLLIGALLSLAYLAATLIFSPSVAAVVLIAASLFLTGALHLDGLADCADAFYGRRTRSATLRILKDPRIGTMGGAAIGLSLLARYAALSSLPPLFILAGLPVISMFSRTAVVLAMRALPYVRAGTGILPKRPSLSPRADRACLDRDGSLDHSASHSGPGCASRDGCLLEDFVEQDRGMHG